MAIDLLVVRNHFRSVESLAGHELDSSAGRSSFRAYEFAFGWIRFVRLRFER